MIPCSTVDLTGLIEVDAESLTQLYNELWKRDHGDNGMTRRWLGYEECDGD